GAERVLVDPERMTAAIGRPHAIDYFVPSWDGLTLAYGMSAGGSEDASLYRMDVATGKAIGEPISRVRDGLVHWSPDSRMLTFNRLRELPKGAAETETFLDSTVFRLKAGDPEAQAKPLFGPLVNKALKMDRLDVAEVIFAADSPYMIARTTDTTVPEGRLFVAPVADLSKGDRITWQPIATAADKVTDIRLTGSTLVLRTNSGAPRGRLLRLPLQEPLLARAVEVAAEPETGVLLGFQAGPDAIYAEIRQGFDTRVRRFAPGSRDSGVDVAPKLAGSTLLTSDFAPGDRDPWLVNSSWTRSTRIFAVAADGTASDTGLLAARPVPGAPEVEVSEVMVESHDGARVPLAILHRKGLELDGSHPTMLVGYGAYGLSYGANFDPRRLAWLERGGVIAYANVRGSGAFGDAWHRAGFKTTKPNTWKDGVACARYLIEQKYASPRTLGIIGGSAGGIFVGRAVTSAPDLFAAAVFDVGMLDTVRSEESANGITNVSEFGTVKDPAEFRALLEMSTYQHIEDGVAYPAVMLIHGMNDPRVDVWQSAKTAARLQAVNKAGKPVLLRLDGDAGHGVGSTARQTADKLADIYTFLLWQFGRMGLKN
ncbi:MAG: prolyl oligopeptidase family serine peptidase, partial [Caldimonas sp.]